MTGLSRETRLQIMLDEAELAAIDNYRFEHRMPSRAAAVRRSSDYGVLPNSDADDGPAGG
jgi:hypothetical protein